MKWRFHNKWAIESDKFYIAKIMGGDGAKYMLTRKNGQTILGWFKTSDEAKQKASELDAN